MKHAGYILDLDGVVYIGSDAVPYAIDALNDAADRGVRLTAATNNANRPAPDVAQHLVELGLRITADDVVTSAQAAAQELARMLPAGSAVLAVGGPGVALALEAFGLRPLRASADLEASNAVVEQAKAIMMGYGPAVAWHDLAAANWAIERGLPWMATNTDSTVPTKFGRAPGNGSLVQALIHASGVEPMVAGKPRPALFERAVDYLGTRNVLVIGDRFDTDIDGAAAAGLDALFVLTGVHGIPELAEQTLDRWPQYVAQDLRSLTQPVATVTAVGDAVSTDSAHPLAIAVVDAAKARMGQRVEVSAYLPQSDPAPLIDVRPLLAAQVAFNHDHRR